MSHYVGRKMSGKNNVLIWHCKCDCGGKRDIDGRYLTMGNATHCGCSRGLKRTATLSRYESRPVRPLHPLINEILRNPLGGERKNIDNSDSYLSA